MKSRLALLSVLVAGLLSGGAGNALAASTGADAAARQYTPTTAENPPLAAPAPATAEQPAPAAPAPRSEVLPETESNPAPESAPAPEAAPRSEPAPAVAAQPAQQVEAGVDDGELPFTGFAAVPVLLLGAALLATGFLLRLRGTNE